MRPSPVSAISGFPFGLTINGNLNSATANAIDVHLMEIAAIRNTAEVDSQGTVLAVVTFPKDNGLSCACDGKPWQDVRLRMSYEKLANLVSKKIQDMFSPRAQKRFRRRLGLEHQLPPGVEYVLDFTPPSEGPELADLTAALWLPRAVKLWFLAGHYIPSAVLEAGTGLPTRPLADKAVGAMLVLGHDDICQGSACLSDYTAWQPKPENPGVVEEPPCGPSHIPTWRKVEDYCPIRHRVAIVRILRAINGEGLLLNSAVRMWTVAQVAISLEIPQVVVDPVTQWLVAPPNTKFIEVCPEKAFQLAYDLRIPSVLIAAFRILVNELAVDYASSDPVPGRPQLTWAQRRRDDYGDYPSDPVEYASREFAERMNGNLQMLQSDNVFGRLPAPNPEWEKLCYLGSLITRLDISHPLHRAYGNLTAALLFAFRQWIDKALEFGSFSSRVQDLIEAQRSHYIPSWERKPLISLYSTLNPAQKVLTPFFWSRLNIIEHRVEFGATFYRSNTLDRHVETFNTELLRALANHTIVPSESHPSLAHLEPPVLQKIQIQFGLPEFHRLLSQGLNSLCASFLATHTSFARDADSGIPFFLSDHLLLCLDESELNYLPIWAGGLDDGSGGVFQQAIPETDMGPSEPGPGYHTGYTAAGDTTAGAPTDDADVEEGDGTTVVTKDGYGPSTISAPSDLGFGGLSLGNGTAGRSLAVQQSGAGTATTSVSGVTPRSEAFTMDAAEDEGMYADARYAQPAAHQAQGMAIEQYVNEAEMEVEAEAGDGDWNGEVQGGMELSLSGDEEMDFGSDDDGGSTLDEFEEVDADEAC
ncbi:hypothetical protein N657DRAFT_679194 [Parathielavia appendiculata]|uniref:Uncharacterized protein n=1 Tax=Parathielavia appendiculata TaxID=2587402 RepID=A0AAN6U4G8_9PEZI|nr:hypothetical protein N657DRAFT_679194 [Parathielavia appendiculata]